MLHEIFFARLHAKTASTTTPLLAIRGDGRPLEITGMRNSYGDLFVSDQVFELQLGSLIENLRTACITMVLANLFKLLDDDLPQLLFGAENRFVLVDVRADGTQFIEQFIDRKLGEAIEL